MAKKGLNVSACCSHGLSQGVINCQRLGCFCFFVSRSAQQLKDVTDGVAPFQNRCPQV